MRPGTRRSAPEMSTPVKLSLYGAVLVLVFITAYLTAGALVPEHVVQDWVRDPGEHAAVAPGHEAPEHAPGGGL